MPELPEVESIRSYLDRTVVGKTISQVELLEKTLFHGNPKDVEGKRIISNERLGKVLAIKLHDGSYLSFHFKLSGQLLFARDAKHATFKNTIPLTQTNKMPGISTRVIFHMDHGGALYFNEMRKFGWVKYSAKIEGPKGVDILAKEFDLDYFKKNITNTRRAIKIVLMDQDRFAGIGNIYANESLFDAHINPEIAANQLTDKQANDLYDSIIETIAKGVKYRGSSGKDEVYVLPDGSKGEYQHHFMVYQQQGKPCKNCGTKIIRIKQGGRSTFMCPKCQASPTQETLL